MKQKTVLVALLLMLSTFLFGQQTVLENQKRFAEPQLKKSGKKEKNTLLKAELESKWKLDSLVYKKFDDATGKWNTLEKYEYAFDENENLTLKILSMWNYRDARFDFMKEEKIYDVNGNVTQFIEYFWDFDTDQYLATWKQEHKYDANGNEELLITYQQDRDTKELIEESKVQTAYNANGKPKLLFRYRWDKETEQWVESVKTEYTYGTNESVHTGYLWNKRSKQWEFNYKSEYFFDTNGNKTQYISYNWDNDLQQWEASRKEEYAYDANGNEKIFITYLWRERQQQWESRTKKEHIYNTNGYLTTIINSKWDIDKEEYINYAKLEHTKNAEGLSTAIRRYRWHKDTEQWVEAAERRENVYDENGNQVKELTYTWNEDKKEWINNETREQVYDSKAPFSALITPDYLYEETETGNIFNHKLDSTLYYKKNEASDDLQLTSKSIYYYSGGKKITSVNQLQPSTVKLFPNPVSENLTINHSSGKRAILELFSLEGQKLMSQTVESNEIINLEDITPGTYIYSILVDGKRSSGKLIKE